MLTLLTLIVALAAAGAAPSDSTSACGAGGIGVAAWHLVDADRDDPMTAARDRREMMLRAWYPTDAQHGVYPGARVCRRATPWPVIVLAPGRGVASTDYAAAASRLVDAGFVVFAVDSPHSGRVRFPDGRVVPPSDALRPPDGLFAGPYAQVDAFFHAAAEAGGLDLAFALDTIDDLNRADPAQRFTGTLRTAGIGLMGHSLGGRIAGYTAARDERVGALFLIEGLAPRDERRAGLPVPTVAVLSDGVYPHAIDNVRELLPARRQRVDIVTLDGMDHNDIVHAAGARHADLLDLAIAFFRAPERPLASSVQRNETVRIEAHAAPTVPGRSP